MKLIIAIVVILAGGLCMISNADAQDAEAEKIHTELKGLYEEMGRDLGFANEDELRGSTLGSPIKVFMSGLDDLEKFGGGDDPHKILVNTKEVIYPIYSGGEFKSSITLVERDGKWELASFGGAEAKLSESSRSKHMTSNRGINQDYMVVHVPAMQQLFVGYDNQGKLFLIPCHDHDVMNFQVDIPMPAENAMLAMQPHVAKFKNVLKLPPPAREGEVITTWSGDFTWVADPARGVEQITKPAKLSLVDENTVRYWYDGNLFGDFQPEKKEGETDSVWITLKDNNRIRFRGGESNNVLHAEFWYQDDDVATQPARATALLLPQDASREETPCPNSR